MMKLSDANCHAPKARENRVLGKALAGCKTIPGRKSGSSPLAEYLIIR